MAALFALTTLIAFIPYSFQVMSTVSMYVCIYLCMYVSMYVLIVQFPLTAVYRDTTLLRPYPNRNSSALFLCCPTKLNVQHEVQRRSLTNHQQSSHMEEQDHQRGKKGTKKNMRESSTFTYLEYCY